jgi:integrase/recombinase XerD
LLRPPKTASLNVLFNTGARVSEVVGLQACDLVLDPAPSVRLRGKGRKERRCPLWAETAKALRALLRECMVAPHEQRGVFLNHRGQPLTRFGVRWILRKHVRIAASRVVSLKSKRLHPHSMRHSTAIHLLRSGVDLSTIANWLGHVSINTTNKYVTLDLEAKRQALDKSEPVFSDRQRETLPVPEHDLIEWLESL